MKTTFLYLFLACCITVSAQQTSTFTHWFSMPFISNPSLTGMQDDIEVMTAYHKKWLGLSGSPETILLGVHGALLPKKRIVEDYHKMGFGVMIYNDVVNVFGKTGGNLNFGYRIQLGENQFLGFGIGAGLTNYRLFFDRIEADNVFEESLLNSIQNQTTLDGTAGLSYTSKKLMLGLSSFQLFQNAIVFGNTADQREIAIRQVRHYSIQAKYTFAIPNSPWRIDPIIYLQSAQGLATQASLGVLGYWKSTAWAGLHYNSSKNIGVNLGIKVNEGIDLGYAYEYPLTDLNRLTSGSHEIMMKFRLKNVARELRKIQKQDAFLTDNVDSTLQSQFEHIDRLEQEKSVIDTALSKQKQKVRTQELVIAELKEQLKEEEKKTKDLVEKLKAESAKKYDEGHKGNQFHVILGVLTSLEVAKQYQKVLLVKTGISSLVIKTDALESGVTHYLISAGKHKTWDKAYAQLGSLRKDRALRSFQQSSPWIYLK